MDTVIIVANLLNQPSEKLAIHWLTTQLRLKEHLSVLVETEDYAKDIYYKFLRLNGLCDGIIGIVTPQESVEAVRIDNELNYPSTIQTDLIYAGNMMRLWKQVHGMTDMHALIQQRSRSIMRSTELDNVKFV